MNGSQTSGSFVDNWQQVHELELLSVPTAFGKDAQLKEDLLINTTFSLIFFAGH